MRAGFVVAIDGPAGSGKSTTARMVAARLKFHHLDTGAMYRAVTLKFVQTGQKPSDVRGVRELLANTAVEVEWRGTGFRVCLDGRDVSREIREPRVSTLVSEVSAIPAVRRAMVATQRRLAEGRRIVCEGRDIGSVVFPDAGLKVFLTCELATRAARRDDELRVSGIGCSRSAVLQNLRKRDRIDSRRKMSPLRRVPDSVLVDTTHLTIEEQVAVVCALARRRMAAARSR